MTAAILAGVQTAGAMAIPFRFDGLVLAGVATSLGLAQGAQGTPPAKAEEHLVAPDALAALLPAPAGWTKGEPILNKVDSLSCAYTTATTTYIKGDMRVKLTIADTGIGIPKAALVKIGQPFEQVQSQYAKSKGGSGLGLAISRSLTRLHGGSMRIYSVEGKGTIISVRIPTGDAIAQPAKAIG